MMPVMKTRTMIYLEPAQHRALKSRAHRLGISVAELIRRLIGERLLEDRSLERPKAEVYRQLVGVGSSGLEDVSERHDAYLDPALSRDHLR